MIAIENWKDFSFISEVFALADRHHWNRGEDLRRELRARRKIARSACESFENTWDKPCGYQDAAGERAEQAGRDYMVHVHAYLICRYGAMTKRLAAIIADTFSEVA